jgi:hypothetical protein
MEVICTSRTSIDFQQTTWRDFPEDSTLQKNYLSKKIGSKRLKVKGLKSYRRKKGRTWEETEEKGIWEGRD